MLQLHVVLWWFEGIDADCWPHVYIWQTHQLRLVPLGCRADVTKWSNYHVLCFCQRYSGMFGLRSVRQSLGPQQQHIDACVNHYAIVQMYMTSNHKACKKFHCIAHFTLDSQYLNSVIFAVTCCLYESDMDHFSTWRCHLTRKCHCGRTWCNGIFIMKRSQRVTLIFLNTRCHVFSNKKCRF